MARLRLRLYCHASFIRLRNARAQCARLLAWGPRPFAAFCCLSRRSCNPRSATCAFSLQCVLRARRALARLRRASELPPAYLFPARLRAGCRERRARMLRAQLICARMRDSLHMLREQPSVQVACVIDFRCARGWRWRPVRNTPRVLRAWCMSALACSPRLTGCISLTIHYPLLACAARASDVRAARMTPSRVRAWRTACAASTA